MVTSCHLLLHEKNPVLHVGRLFKDTSYQDAVQLAHFAMHSDLLLLTLIAPS